MRSIILVAHNIRSTHNVGAILRTADGFAVERVIYSGYTPYPQQPHDERLPHLTQKITQQIAKTALGAELTMAQERCDNPLHHLGELRQAGYRIVALEQAMHSIPLSDYRPPDKIVLILGEEVLGIPTEILALCDEIVEIPMLGHKESFNVSVATGIALYGLRFRMG